MQTVSEGHLWLLSLKMWMPLMAEFQPKKMAETLKISQEHVKFISHDELDMRKLAVKWVPKSLNVNQECDRVLASQAILEHFR